jgi:hypothetical protein
MNQHFGRPQDSQSMPLGHGGERTDQARIARHKHADRRPDRGLDVCEVQAAILVVQIGWIESERRFPQLILESRVIGRG